MTREDYSGYRFDPEEDEGSLSDLDEDINQYIATTSEVEFCTPPPPPPTHTHTVACALTLKMCLLIVVFVYLSLSLFTCLCLLFVFFVYFLSLCTGGAEASSHEPAY